MAEAIPFKYRAFLSYSHRDKAWAKWLHSALEGYRIDKDLVGRATPVGPVPRTLRPIFRDREDFSAGHSLTAQTLAALEASQFLIVICSPNAARSKYVNEEIRRFKAIGRADRVIPVIVDGDPGDPERECFPRALCFKLDSEGTLTDEREEPIAADARPEGDGKETAKQKVVAGLLGLGLDEIARRAERVRKRQVRFRTSIIALLLTLTIVSGTGFVWARYELSRNEALLDRTLQRATSLVNKATALSDRFGVPRSVSLGVLEEAEGLFRDMAELGRDTQKLRYRKAVMLVAFARDYAAVGDTVAQRARTAEAHQLMQGLAVDDARNPDWQRDLAVTYDEVGDVLVAQGDLTAAFESYQAGRFIRERFVAADQYNTSWLRELAMSHDRIGTVLVDQGKLVEALNNYGAGRAIMENLASADPNNIGWQNELSMFHQRIGDVLFTKGNLAAAIESYRANLAIAERLATTYPLNTRWQSDFGVSLNKIADVLAVQGNLTAALQFYRRSLEVCERLASADPRNAKWQRDLAVGHDNIGDVLRSQGNLATSFESYGASLAIRETIVSTDPKNAGWQRDLGVSHDKIGDVLVRQGNLTAALNSYRAGIAITEKLTAADPTNTNWQRDLAVTHSKIGNMLVAQGDLVSALISYRNGHEIIERLTATDPNNAEWQRDLSVSYSKIADVLRGQRKPATALEHARASLAAMERLSAIDPKSVSWQHDVAISHTKIGQLLTDLAVSESTSGNAWGAQDNLGAALESYRVGLAIFERVAAADPENAGWQRDMAASHSVIGDVFTAQGKLAAALESYAAGLAVLERLAAADPTNVEAQWDMLLSHWRLAINGNESARRWALIVTSLRKLKTDNKLTDEQARWLPKAEAQLAKLQAQ